MDPTPPTTRAGYVAIVGRPNAGKSTLLNRLVGEHLAITSPKPQSTRDRVVGILTIGNVQIAFLDTPGLLEPRYALQEAMRATALQALDDADVIIYLVDAAELVGAERVPGLAEVARLERAPSAPVILALNKCDLVPTHARAALEQATRHGSASAHAGGTAFPEHSAQYPPAHEGSIADGGLEHGATPPARVVAVSAMTGEGIDTLIAEIGVLLPESPFLYPEDEISTHPVRYFIAEMIREAALEQLDEEVPYAIACEVDEFREERRPVYIRATIYVERPTQRGIVIGAGGARLRSIGRAARVRAEAFIGAPVYLDLWVKVLPNWRRDDRALRRFGYRRSSPSDR